MKRFLYFIGGILFLFFSSVGFRYAPAGFGSLVNLYLHDTLLLAADEKYGIKAYSVADPDNPVLITSVPLCGVRGMAMKGDILYAGSWYGIFSYRVSNGGYMPLDTIVSYYRCAEDVVLEPEPWYSPLNCGCMPLGGPVAVAGGSSEGGSYAVFAVIDTFLYYIDKSALVTMSVAEAAHPRQITRCEIGWTIETLHPTERYLFIGGTRGMYVMDRTDGAKPALVGSFQHAKGCDPVVVQDTVAYVTLRSGNRCGDAADELLTVSIADPANPRLIGEFPVETPYGLSVRDSLIYISNGYGGYGLYAVRSPDTVILRKRWQDTPTKDFIRHGDLLYIMGFNRIDLMDISDPLLPVTLSTIQ